MKNSVTVYQLGEQAILQRLQAFCPVGVVGDDAAVLQVPEGRSLVVTTDLLVDGVHFSDQTTTPEDAGWRAAAANLSDLAAMGATPIGITVGLGLPGTRTIDWLERLYHGMMACLDQSQTPIVGGDVCRSPMTTIAITALGSVHPQQTIQRSQAQVGDAIVVTGYHGASKAGLDLLLQPELGAHLSLADRQALIKAHQRPQPRLDVLPHLNCSRPIAGMDSSDGLADAVVQICRASGVGAEIDRHQIPLPPGLLTFPEAIDWALYGGEDFELVLCLPLESAQTLVQQLGAGAAIVGTITANPEVWLLDTIGQHAPVRLTLERGFQHFG